MRQLVAVFRCQISQSWKGCWSTRPCAKLWHRQFGVTWFRNRYLPPKQPSTMWRLEDLDSLALEDRKVSISSASPARQSNKRMSVKVDLMLKVTTEKIGLIWRISLIKLHITHSTTYLNMKNPKKELQKRSRCWCQESCHLKMGKKPKKTTSRLIT